MRQPKSATMVVSTGVMTAAETPEPAKARPVARPRFSTNQLLMSVVSEMPASVMEPVP